MSSSSRPPALPIHSGSIHHTIGRTHITPLFYHSRIGQGSAGYGESEACLTICPMPGVARAHGRDHPLQIRRRQVGAGGQTAAVAKPVLKSGKDVVSRSRVSPLYMHRCEINAFRQDLAIKRMFDGLHPTPPFLRNDVKIKEHVIVKRKTRPQDANFMF
jgi:hypothetical protein